MMAEPRFPNASRAPWALHRFGSLAQASAALAAFVVAELEAAIAARGEASLALPGGASPRELLRLLGYRSLDWRHVHLTLTDERWVAPDHARSNAGQVERLMPRGVRGARWFPLWRPGLSPAAGVELIESQSAALPWPLDVIVLGMGEDGHVASLFPGDPSGYPAQDRRFVAVTGPGGEPRVSLTAGAIAAARKVCLLVGGQRKLDVLAGAGARDLPVWRVLQSLGDRARVFAGD
jgi:6-phosphogluconolactonase